MKEEYFDAPMKTSKRPKGWGARHTFVVLTFLGYVVSYAMRFNLSLTIVAMVRHKPLIKIEGGSETLGTYCDSGEVAITTINSSTTLIIDKDAQFAEFDWNEAEQGLILGSFFWGYFLTQLPGGLLATRYGGKWVLGVSLFITAICTLLTPIAARMGQMYLIVVRVIMGFAEGFTFPAGTVLLAKWIPIEERSKLATIVYSGISIGASITMLVSGFLIESFGWTSVFYAIGVFSVGWFAAWAYVICESPAAHPTISEEERNYITKSTATNAPKSNRPTPWLKMWTSPPVIAICIGQTAFAWGLYTLLIELPTYLKTVLHFDIKQNSLTSSSPYLCMFLVGTLLTSIGDKLMQKGICSTLFCRKMCNTIAQWGTALALVGVAYSGCNAVVTILCLNLAVGLTGTTFGGCLVSSMDIAPNYAGIITGIANSFANICGFAAPYVAGLLIKGNPSIEQWRLVFLISAAFLFVGNLSFIIFGKAQVLDWNSEDENETENGKSKIGALNGGLARKLSSTSFQL